MGANLKLLKLWPSKDHNFILSWYIEAGVFFYTAVYFEQLECPALSKGT